MKPAPGADRIGRAGLLGLLAGSIAACSGGFHGPAPGPLPPVAPQAKLPVANATPAAVPDIDFPKVTPSSLHFTALHERATIRAIELLYRGVFSAKSENPAIVTVAPAVSSRDFSVESQRDGSTKLLISDSANHATAVDVVVTSAKPTPAPTPKPTEKPTPKPTATPTAKPTPTGSPGMLSVKPSTIVVSPDDAAVTVLATEPNYTGLITATSNCNPTEVVILPPVSVGPTTPFVFTFEGAPPGPAPGHDQCTAAFQSSGSPPATVDVAIVGYTMFPNPTAATISISNPQPVTLTVTEKGYTDGISVANPNPGVLNIAPLAAKGPKATFTISLVKGYKGGPADYQLEISDSFNEYVFMKLSIVN